MSKVKNLYWDELELQEDEPITLYPETSPHWFRTICPLETPQEKFRRIEGEMKDAERQKKHLIESHRTRMESIDDRLLFLMDQRLKTINEIEAMGDEV
jgi:hypothetical protein